MREFGEELDEAVQRLDEHYAELKGAARERLGSLYDRGDYPDSLVGMFAIEHDFPSAEPPNYLRQLNPELYEEECRRVQARFDEAVRLAEAAFTSELARIVSHLTERLTEPIVLEGIDLGRFEIALDAGSGPHHEWATYEATALDANPAVSDSEVTHPHVQAGQLCEGEVARPEGQGLPVVFSAAAQDHRWTSVARDERPAGGAACQKVST